MTNWIRQQIRGRLFRKIFLALITASMLPLLILIFFWVGSDSRILNGSSGLFHEFLGVVFLALLLAGVIAFYLSRYLTTPISEITKGATKIARGNFSHQIEVKSDDEVGRLARLFNYMTTELRRLDDMNLAKIIAERNKTQTIIRNIADGVIVTDPKLSILVINSSAEKWFSLDENKVLNHPLTDFIQEPKLANLISDATKTGRRVLPAAEITVKGNRSWKSRVLQARAARVQQDNGELVGIVTILRDVTQQKEIDKMKTELVSMVAHELRSPLTSISGFSELLLDSDITKKQSQEYAGIILKEATRLSDLINKFLDISRIESGRIQPNKVKLDLLEIIQMVVGNNSYLATRKGIDVEIHEPAKSVHVKADSGMMEQVFLNLFSNAIKYSPGSTRIDFVLKSTQDQVIVEVHDQGYGIPTKALPRIFDKFYRVTESENLREITGTGLGLPLVKQIIEMHGGHVEAESEEGRGSVFSVYLPQISNRQKVLLEEENSEDIIL
ncbi:MAG: HAMP domain-containing protein [Actinobacteria bacterium]|nr:HAMP domain-containing protein [Actinomycetota bacterium]